MTLSTAVTPIITKNSSDSTAQVQTIEPIYTISLTLSASSLILWVLIPINYPHVIADSTNVTLIALYAIVKTDSVS